MTALPSQTSSSAHPWIGSVNGDSADDWKLDDEYHWKLGRLRRKGLARPCKGQRGRFRNKTESLWNQFLEEGCDLLEVLVQADGMSDYMGKIREGRMRRSDTDKYGPYCKEFFETFLSYKYEVRLGENRPEQLKLFRYKLLMTYKEARAVIHEYQWMKNQIDMLWYQSTHFQDQPGVLAPSRQIGTRHDFRMPEDIVHGEFNHMWKQTMGWIARDLWNTDGKSGFVLHSVMDHVWKRFSQDEENLMEDIESLCAAQDGVNAYIPPNSYSIGRMSL